MKKMIPILILCLLTLSACSLYSIQSDITSAKYYPPKEADQVNYVENAQKSHEVIGIVIVNAERNQKMDRVLQKLKYEAGILGGDAVTNIQTNDGQGRWARIKPKIFENSNVRANFMADVIVYQ